MYFSFPTKRFESKKQQKGGANCQFFTPVQIGDSIMFMTGIFEMFTAGGFIMYPLLVCSLITWAVALERIFTLQKSDALAQDLYDKVAGLIESGKKDEAIDECVRSPIPVARVLEDTLKFLKNNAADEATIAKRIARKRHEMNLKNKRYIWTLGTIGSASPFLGLFGTVVGILRAFNKMSITGQTGFQYVAGEISEALIATAAGIIVAVIAVAFYNYLQVRINRIAAETRLALEDIVDSFNSAGAR